MEDKTVYFQPPGIKPQKLDSSTNIQLTTITLLPITRI